MTDETTITVTVEQLTIDVDGEILYLGFESEDGDEAELAISLDV